MFYEPKEIDCSIPYKTFNDLKNGDIIYKINYTNFEIEKFKIKEYNKKEESNYYQKNCYKIEFTVEEIEYGRFCISNGNVFGYHFRDSRIEGFYITDERICDLLISIMKERNSYQWQTFTSLFGNPMGCYAHKEIKLR